MRITQAHIENLVEWVNTEKGYPMRPWVRTGLTHYAQINNIHAYRSSGYWNVVQIVNTGGGERTLRRGTAREVYEFLLGMQAAMMMDQFAVRNLEVMFNTVEEKELEELA